jgi:hypothetical protein
VVRRRGPALHPGERAGGHRRLLPSVAHPGPRDGPRRGRDRPLATNPQALACGSGVQRRHSGADVPAPHTEHDAYFATWYATHQYLAVAPHIEEWGPIDYQNPSNQLYYPPTRQANNSRGRPELLSVDLRSSDFAPYVVGGIANVRTYTDHLGKLVSGCTTVSLDCVPLVIEGVRQYGYQWSANVNKAGAAVDRDYDVMSPVTGTSLIRFPN